MTRRLRGLTFDPKVGSRHKDVIVLRQRPGFISIAFREHDMLIVRGAIFGRLGQSSFGDEIVHLPKCTASTTSL